MSKAPRVFYNPNEVTPYKYQPSWVYDPTAEGYHPRIVKTWGGHVVATQWQGLDTYPNQWEARDAAVEAFKTLSKDPIVCPPIP